jgi:hypothetical protein
MTCGRITLALFCSLALIVGCAKTDDASQSGNGAATQPTAGLNQSAQTAAMETAATAPAASMLTVDRTQEWFPSACLRLDTKNGKVIARLYSDDPREVLTGKTTVNSFDLMMVLPGISDPADIGKATWVNPSASMDRENSPYGIFLNHQQDVLQPMEVTVRFEGAAPRVKVLVQGSFAMFHVGDRTPQAVPAVVNVFGVLDTTVSAGK